MTHAAQAARDEGGTVSGLALAVRELFEPLGLVVVSEAAEPESAEYGGKLVGVAARGDLGRDGTRTGGSLVTEVRVRSGKITPTKDGLFVTHWRRTADGTTGPFHADDSAETLLVTVAESGPGPAGGVFVFGRTSLVAHGIVARDGRGGKRGFRVYPPWSQTAPGQAARTQRWQLDHFVSLPLVEGDLVRAQKLMRVQRVADGSSMPSETEAQESETKPEPEDQSLRQTADGRRQTADGRRQTADGRRQTAERS